jgi:hypothetical protein
LSQCKRGVKIEKSEDIFEWVVESEAAMERGCLNLASLGGGYINSRLERKED